MAYRGVEVSLHLFVTFNVGGVVIIMPWPQPQVRSQQYRSGTGGSLDFREEKNLLHLLGF
jgi:hypothetical protein